MDIYCDEDYYMVPVAIKTIYRAPGFDYPVNIWGKWEELYFAMFVAEANNIWRDTTRISHINKLMTVEQATKVNNDYVSTVASIMLRMNCDLDTAVKHANELDWSTKYWNDEYDEIFRHPGTVTQIRMVGSFLSVLLPYETWFANSERIWL